MGASRLPKISVEEDDESSWIRIPSDLLIPVSDDPLEAVVSNTVTSV